MKLFNKFQSPRGEQARKQEVTMEIKLLDAGFNPLAGNRPGNVKIGRFL